MINPTTKYHQKKSRELWKRYEKIMVSRVRMGVGIVERIQDFHKAVTKLRPRAMFDVHICTLQPVALGNKNNKPGGSITTHEKLTSKLQFLKYNWETEALQTSNVNTSVSIILGC